MIGLRGVAARTDWSLLREQKKWLVSNFRGVPEATGLIHLIDSLQDAAVEEGIATEEEVFGDI